MDCSQIIIEIEDVIKKLWQGKNIDVERVTTMINSGVQTIADSIPEMAQKGINFPLEYITAAMKNMTTAIERRDDYMLADNLMYEWIDIFTVFGEIIAQLKE